MKKILVIFGTRPEAIKLAPVIIDLKKRFGKQVLVCSTGQHREMLKQVLDIFNLKIDFDLDLMKSNQDLFDISSNSLIKLKKVYQEILPELVIVQGDTTTAFMASLAAYYLKIKIAHVEAGLRSYNIYSPYPEEANRRFISTIAKYNFAPTKDAKKNLLNEGFESNGVVVTGNTVIDALYLVSKRLSQVKAQEFIQKLKLPRVLFDKKIILITLHRREKFGIEFKGLIETIKKLSIDYPEYNFVYPVHLNPNVKMPVEKSLSNIKNVFLLSPLGYLDFNFLMNKCHFIMTDSGGIQEECYFYKKPVMILRDVTERNEAIKAGYAFLLGSNSSKIINKFKDIDKKLKLNFNFFKVPNPFGDGKASQRITRFISKNLQIK
jgi:UDP-N-acetylglucosamine 2-epimerase (non-hydrolysing)